MENNVLRFKDKFYPETGRVYSVCMRGARRWDTQKPLIIYDGGNGELIDTPISAESSHTAIIASQRQFKFEDLAPEHCWDNYDPKARSKNDLLKAMHNVYSDFDIREIVTMLRFVIAE